MARAPTVSRRARTGATGRCARRSTARGIVHRPGWGWVLGEFSP
ncbi:hypothetical protein ABTK30_20265 [Acinetobacter baumannii]